MKLSPSLLSADFSRLLDEAKSVEPHVERFHWDVMDGHFVPNLTFGPPVVNALRSKLDLPFDIHLMIDHPDRYADRFDIHPDDVIIFHIESEGDPGAMIDLIRQRGARCGITLRPGTGLDAIAPWLDHVTYVLVMSVEPGFGGQTFIPESLDRIRELRRLIDTRDIDIAVDGGINVNTIGPAVAAGADILVAGSAVFGASDRLSAIRTLRAACA